MLSEELIKTLGLYVNHMVCLQMTDSEDMLTGCLLGYTENEVVFTVDEVEEERLPFEKLEDVLYKGHVTSYQKKDRTGMIDENYTFRTEDCVGSKAGRELSRYSEYEYGVCCHLVAAQDKARAGGMRIAAKDVSLEPEPHHVLPMHLLTEEAFLYKLRRREDQIGVLEQKGSKYAVGYEGRKTTYFDKSAIADIFKCPKVNDYVTVTIGVNDVCGVVTAVERECMYIFTAEGQSVRILYEECKRIRYWGRVTEVNRNTGETLFLIDGVYPVTEACRKGYGQGRGKKGLKHGMTVSFILGINKEGFFVREYSVEEEMLSPRMGVITSFEGSGKGYIGTSYERGAELRKEDAKAFFLEEDLEKRISLDLSQYVYVVKYDTVTQQGAERVISLEISEIYDRSFVSSVRVKEDGEVCVIPRECEDLYYYLNREVLAVRKENGELVQGRCIYIDEAAKKMVLLCGDGKESRYRAVAFEDIATVRRLDRLTTYGEHQEEVLEEKKVVILDYREKKGYLVMNPEAYASEDASKKVWYYLPFGAQADAEALKKEYYRYDYPATLRVLLRDGELQKVVEIGEGIEKQDESAFFPVTGRRRGYGFIVTYNKQAATATICAGVYPKGSEEEAKQERRKIDLQGTGWDEILTITNKHIYFVVYAEEYDAEKEAYVITDLLSVEMYPRKQIHSAEVIDGKPKIVLLSDIDKSEESETVPVIKTEEETELPSESKTATELSIGETIFFWDTAYEYVGKTKDEKLKVRTIPFGGKMGFEQDLTRERLAIRRFGLLTGMDRVQGVAYINEYLRVPLTYLDERAAVAFGNGKKKVVVSYLWDTDGRAKEVSVPGKNILSALSWKKGIVSAVLSEEASGCTVLIRLEEEEVTAEYHFAMETKQNVRRRNYDFVGEPVYVRAIKATYGKEKDLDVTWYALEIHFANETATVNEVLKGKPQGEPDKLYVVRVRDVKYPADMEYADYWAEHVENEVEVRLVPHLSETEETEELWAVPADLPVGV